LSGEAQIYSTRRKESSGIQTIIALCLVALAFILSAKALRKNASKRIAKEMRPPDVNRRRIRTPTSVFHN
jgi:hypothetical protein